MYGTFFGLLVSDITSSTYAILARLLENAPLTCAVCGYNFLPADAVRGAVFPNRDIPRGEWGLWALKKMDRAGLYRKLFFTLF